MVEKPEQRHVDLLRDAVDVDGEVDVRRGVTLQLRARDVQRQHLLAAGLDVGHLLEVQLQENNNDIL